MSDSVLAKKQKVKHPDESLLYAVDFGELLQAGETIDTVDAVASTPTGELTISDQAPNTSTLQDDEGNTIAVREAVQLRVAGGVAGTDYRIEVTVTTVFGEEEGNTRVGVLSMQVDDGSV